MVEEEYPKLLEEVPLAYGLEHRELEHGSYIIESLETGRIYRGCFNLPNKGAIANLPDDCVVESPCYVDATGVHQAQVGGLPIACAALCITNINVQRLSVEAAVYGDITQLRQAMMMDPLVGAILNPQQIWQMTDDMLIAQEKWLPQYAQAIAGAKTRQNGPDRIPTKASFEGVSANRRKGCG